MNLLYTDVEEELRASVRAVLADRKPPDRLWRTLAVDVGCAGLAVPESSGGAGASLRECAVVLEELGRGLAPVPFLGSAVMATTALLAAGESALLEELAKGARTAALAVPFSTAPGARPERDGPTGTVTSVADALTADVLLVPTSDGLYIVDDVTRTPVTSLDLTRPLCDVTLDGTATRIADADTGRRAVDAALVAGAALLASEQLGVAQWCLDTTVAYVRTRYQFGRPIGSFQAIKHRLAELWVAVTQARAVARYAAGCVAVGDPDAPVAAALAQAFCGPVAVTAAEECVQLHGGIGFTWEHPAHLYLKRAKSAALALGTADRHRTTLAELVDLVP
jgi:alkylation response protein AidB-like acyl-CoA dehydrogenase